MKLYLDVSCLNRPSEDREQAASAVQRLGVIASEQQAGRRAMLDWLRVEFGIAKASQKLRDVGRLDAAALTAEVKKTGGRARPLSVAQARRLQAAHATTRMPLQTLGGEARMLETRVSELVNAASVDAPNSRRHAIGLQQRGRSFHDPP